LTHSVNTVSVSVLERLGNRNSYRFLTEKLRFSSLDPTKDLGSAALALGQQYNGVTLCELVAGYTSLANNGVYSALRSYTRVLDHNDQPLLENQGQQERVLDADYAAIMTMMLRQVVTSGTAKALTLNERVDVAGKTGTSGNNCDKWFIGYTPELLCGVWYGYEYPESLSDVKGNPALNVFDRVMNEAVLQKGIRQRQFDTGENLVAVRYCRDSGKLMSEACYFDPRGDRSEVGYFKKGTEPREHCDCHVCVSYCRAGGVATSHCPQQECHQTALVRVMRQFPRQIKVLDAPYTWAGNVPETEQYLSDNEPYYALNYQTRQYFGIGMDIAPYNRICPFHTVADPFWSRRSALSS
jgi:penicillin-binding protein 1A